MNLLPKKLLPATVMLWGALAPFSGIAHAEADLMVHPVRVVLTDKQRTAQVDILNTSDTQATYKIALVRRRMTEAGQFLEVRDPEPEERFADELVKYSPRQVTLLPGAGQTIRILFKIPPDLKGGEYRSHLLITRPRVALDEQSGQEVAEPNVISMKLTTNIGISVPVIVRHGPLQAAATIAPGSVGLAALDRDRQLVTFTLARSGTRSVYGDLLVLRGDEKVAEERGVAVYTPNRTRRIGIPVQESSRLKPGDVVRILFTEREERKPLAEATVVLP